MTVFLLKVMEENTNIPHNVGIYSTEEKVKNAIMALAICKNEPALLLEHEYDTPKNAEYWHYHDYKGTIYYVEKFRVD